MNPDHRFSPADLWWRPRRLWGLGGVIEATSLVSSGVEVDELSRSDPTPPDEYAVKVLNGDIELWVSHLSILKPSCVERVLVAIQGVRALVSPAVATAAGLQQ
jgi:hypothetical protein